MTLVSTPDQRHYLPTTIRRGTLPLSDRACVRSSSLWEASMLKREPAVLAGIILAGLPAIYGFLSAFDLVSWGEGQQTAITALYVFGATLVIYLLRGTVWSPASVERLREQTHDIDAD